MSWFFIALGAPFLWAIVNISDQYMVKKYSVGHNGSGGLVLFSSLIGIVITIMIGIFAHDIFKVPSVDRVLLIIAGGLSIAWIVIYLYTIEIEDISFIVPWFSIVPVFGYILGYIFLGENLSFAQLIGSIIILLGVIIISIDFSIEEKFRFKWKPVIYMFFACFIIAVIGAIFKHVTITDNFWSSSFWEYFGLGFFGILIYLLIPKYRREFLYMNKIGGLKIFTINTVSEFITVLGNLLSNYAILLAPITMIYIVESFQPAIVLILVVLGTKFFPKIIIEKIHKQVMVPKIIAIIIMIIGGVFLFV